MYKDDFNYSQLRKFFSSQIELIFSLHLHLSSVHLNLMLTAFSIYLTYFSLQQDNNTEK